MGIKEIGKLTIPNNTILPGYQKRCQIHVPVAVIRQENVIRVYLPPLAIILAIASAFA